MLQNYLEKGEIWGRDKVSVKMSWWGEKFENTAPKWGKLQLCNENYNENLVKCVEMCRNKCVDSEGIPF